MTNLGPTSCSASESVLLIGPLHEHWDALAADLGKILSDVVCVVFNAAAQHAGVEIERVLCTCS